MATPGSWGAGWRGHETLLDINAFHGWHTKNPARRINTDIEKLADTKDRDVQKPRRNAYLGMGDRIREVYHSNLQFDTNEAEWHFGRCLGAGSFGLVASWDRRQRNHIIDTLVTKSEKAESRNAVHPFRPDVSSEVFNMAQLNGRKCVDGWPQQGIVQLRGYKYLYGDISAQGNGTDAFLPRPGNTDPPLYREWRTYMENCNFGNISRVIYTYKAWGYHVPEAFVWWAFFWLIQGCRAMDDQTGEGFMKWEGANKLVRERDNWMLANDIKTDNCFLGPARAVVGAGVPFDQYPTARIGDFGLAQVVKLDLMNRRKNLHAGTEPWTAPEKRRVEFGTNYDGTPTYPFYKPRRVDPLSWTHHQGRPEDTESHCIGPEANLWTVGVIIYMLMTFENVRDIDRRVNNMLRPDFPNRDNAAVDQYLFYANNFPTRLTGEEVYSRELRNLVADITRLEPLRRRNVENLRQEITYGIERERARLVEAFGGDDAAIAQATRMAFTNEDWRSVPKGPFHMMPRPVPGSNNRVIGQPWFDYWWHVEQWDALDAVALVPPGRASELPTPGNVTDKIRPFVGEDMVLYLQPGTTNGYYQGPALPNGGRAQGPHSRIPGA